VKEWSGIMVALGFEISVCRLEEWLGMSGVKIFPLAKSRRVFTPLVLMLDFWKMFFCRANFRSCQNAAEPLWPSLGEASDKAEMLARSLACVSIFTQERGKALVLKQKI
jgi:hypothetical protein